MLATTQNSTQQQIKFKNTAVSIANYLAKEAIWDGDRCNWIGHSVENVSNKYQVVRQSFSRDFYSGTSGIAYFLASLLRFHEDPIIEEVLNGCMNQVLQLNEKTDHLASNFGFHGGRMGIAFSIIESGKLRKNQAWINEGLALLDKICHSEIQEYELDIISGVAGAIPILLRYHKEFNNQLYLDTAIRCGQSLLDKATKTETSWAWLSPMSSKALTGYSHGNAGIALALLELYAYTQEPKYYTAAMYGFNYERTLYNPTVQNWPDLREMGTGQTPSTPTYGEAWCHGAPGIALSRLRAWELSGDNTFKQEAEIALSTTYKGVYNMLTQQSEHANFSLCHGLAGNVDILFSGAEKLSNSLYVQIAHQAAELGIEKYEKTGLNWPSGVNDPSQLTKGMGETPGFMLGLSGTGYFYLRLAYPGQVESLLVL
ncbi:MAG: hypothetical protein P1U56_09115 [Saprospiraceae bacterium]|nr:hypothetical protein [Saprospiraceae bacterium]